MKLRGAPEDLTEDEDSLGFRRLLIQGVEREREIRHTLPGVQLQPLAVIARILSRYEILLKLFALDGSTEYSHQRFGYIMCGGVSTRPDWYPASLPVKNAAMFIQEYEVGVSKVVEFRGAAFTPVLFQFEAV